jgi:tagatose 6-phosphate kinase
VILCICLSPAIDVTYRVPHLVEGGTNRVHAVTRRPGGKAVNVARVLHALGDDVQLLAPVGGDTGAEFSGDLAALGITADLVPSTPATRRTVAVVDDATGDVTMLTEPAIVDSWAELAARAGSAIARAECVVISGALPEGAPSGAMRTLVELAHQAGRPVLVDTSGPPLLDALAARPTLVKPNAAELAEASGDDDPLRAACRLARSSGATVVASLGRAGVIAASADAAWRIRPARPLAGNPTGAGDALVAGLARGLTGARPLPDRLADAVALSAAAVLSPHAGDVDPAHYAEQRAGVVVRALDAVR